MPLQDAQPSASASAGKGGSGQSGIIVGVIVGVLLFMSIIIHGQNVLRGVLEEKSSRVAEVVVSSVKPEALLAGKVLGVGAVGLTQQVAWFAIAGYLSQFIHAGRAERNWWRRGDRGGNDRVANGSGIVEWPRRYHGADRGRAFAFFIVGFTFYAALYAAAGSMVNSEQEAQQAAVPVMLLIMSTWLMVNPVLHQPEQHGSRW